MENPDNTILFEPLKVGNLSLPNRIIMAPMTRFGCENGIPGEINARYYRRRIEGGTGLLLTECAFVNHPAANAYEGSPAFYGEAALAGWRLVVEQVHQAGGKIMPQIWHAGPIRDGGGTLTDQTVPAYGPVEIRDGDTITTVGMTKQDIDEVTQAFAQAAADAKSIGFDGVEIHGAHSYLIDQFLWKHNNSRDDEYGGSIENRVRFACDIVRAVRKAVGPDFPLIFRFSQWKQGDYEAQIAETPEELEQILLPLSEAGVDIFHPSARRFWEPAFANSELSLAAWTKKISGKPTIAVGSIGIDKPLDMGLFAGERSESQPVSITDAVAAMQRGEFDLIAVGRALLGDPDWANKIRDGAEDQIAAFSTDVLAELV